MTKPVIVFSGFNQRAVVAFLRTLEAQGVQYAIIAATTEDTIFLTNYESKVLATREVKQLQFDDLENCINIVKSNLKSEQLIIAPSTEALNRYLLKYREKFEDLGCEIPLVNETIYEGVSDKYKFGELCKANDIRIPVEYAALDEASLPCVAKPKQYLAKDGTTPSPVLINDEKDKKEFIDKNNQDEFYYQEYVDGKSLYLLYYFYKDSSVTKFSQENFIQQPGGKSMIAAGSSEIHTESVSSEYEELFRNMKFRGLVMVEVKKSEKDYFMIEANPRFWGPSQLFVDAKNNFFEAFLYDRGIIANKPQFKPVKQIIKYFWSGGIYESMREFGYVDYHDYSKEQYELFKDDWTRSDVYNRQDTREIYKKEME